MGAMSPENIKAEISYVDEKVIEITVNPPGSSARLS